MEKHPCKAKSKYPRTLQEMCAMGEETGELDSSLKVIGDFYTNEADTATKDALAKLEPTMLVLLAVLQVLLSFPSICRCLPCTI
ncbi:type II secretion system F family protein [Bacillota bacterium LCP21S3_D9]|nr:type II secretion system F family protein [Bacillota bacterium]